MVGPSFSGKTYLMPKILSRIPDRDIYIFNKSTPEQYSNSKIKIKEIGKEMKHLNEYENAIIDFHVILVTSNSIYIQIRFSVEGDILIYIIVIYHNPILI